MKKILSKSFFLSAICCFLASSAYSAVSQGWEKHFIADQSRPIYIMVEDMDGDGDLDIVSTTNEHPGLFYSEVSWFMNNLNNDTQWEQFIISSSVLEDNPVTDINGVAVSDIDNDGYNDVVVGTGSVGKLGGKVYWFKAPAEPEGEWQRFLVSSDDDNAYFKMYVLDADEDGREDIVAGGNAGSIIFINPEDPEQDGVVWERVLLNEETGSSNYLDDINGDGEIDIINSKLRGNVSWIDVDFDGEEIIFDRTVIDGDLDLAFDVNCMDVDGDSLKDVIVSTLNTPGIYWYKAPSQTEGLWTKNIVSENYNGTDIYTGDINGDGKKDAIISGAFIDNISWFEYDTIQQSWTEYLIDDFVDDDTDVTGEYGDPGDVSLDDLDGDGDLDIVLAGLREDQMLWYENSLNELISLELDSFSATPGSSKVIIQWATSSETNNAGFNVYRAESEKGEYEKINIDLVLAESSPTEGGTTYNFTDKDVENRNTYFYMLEDIDIHGAATMHSLVESATPRLLYLLIGR